jgi:hypothetical protein
MIGCDFQFEFTATWPPIPVPFTSHLVAQRLAGFGGASMTSDDVLANNWNIIQRDSDIQYGIPHIPLPPWPPCVLALVWTGLSGSKSYFGPSSVVSSGGPIAAALFVYVNPQLNCDDPLPLPTGIAITWSNVVCGLTWGDVIGGALSMAFDMLISFVLGKISNKIAGKLTPKNLAKWEVEVIQKTVSAVFQQLTGSPIGYTWSLPGHVFGDAANAGDWGPMLGHPIGEWIGRVAGLDSPAPMPPSSSTASHIVNDPGVEQH